MTRTTVALLLCCISLLGATAAPAPPVRPSNVWVTGWDRPEDPPGGCRFDRTGERLTINVPGSGLAVDSGLGLVNAPYLLCAVEGDFVLQVRPRLSVDGDSIAGLLLASGADVWTNAHGTWNASDGEPRTWYFRGEYKPSEQEGCNVSGTIDLEGGALWLRLERRGQGLVVRHSLDGRAWQSAEEVPFYRAPGGRLPSTVKVGVFAGRKSRLEARRGLPRGEEREPTEARYGFQAKFDEFNLTPLGRGTKR